MAKNDDEDIGIDAKNIDIEFEDDNKEEEYNIFRIQSKVYQGGGGGPPRRFIYSGGSPSKRRSQIIGLIIFIILIGAVLLLYVFPSWLGSILLQNQLYANKAGNLSFWEFYYLDGWNTTFIFNYTGLIGALIGSIIMSIHPLNRLFKEIGQRANSHFLMGMTKKKAFIFWWTIGFVIFYFIGLGINGSYSMFSFTIYEIKNGHLSFSIEDILLPFIYLSNLNGITAQSFMAPVFAYQNIVMPIMNFILGVLVFKLILLLYEEGTTYRSKRINKITSYVFLLIGTFFAFGFVSIPTRAYDKLSLILVWSIPIGMFGFYILGIIFFIISAKVGKSKKKKSSRTVTSAPNNRKIAGAVFILIVAIILPLFISIPTAIGINNNYNMWLSGKWNLMINKQIEWTHSAAGLEIFDDRREISNLTESSTSNLVKYVRQYDKEAAIYQMNTIAQSPFETLGDSDIVYLDGKEYWVAPKTLKVQHFEGDPIKSNTNMFDHVEGFIALETYNGTIILNETEFYSIFGVNLSYPIFFGEYASGTLENYDWYYFEEESSYTTYGAFDDDILLNTGWTDNETNYKYVYEGTPDGKLTGLPAFWYTTNLGLFSYAINSSFEKEFLINRNIFTRINQILLPGLWIDPDPYLVFDKNNHKMYYALSICTDLPLGSYSNSPILRFLGVALIDTKTGEISWVENPMFEDNEFQNDPTYNIWKIYRDKYPWHSIDESEYSWLKAQLRYPENLFEVQLQYDYKYHVKDSESWYSAAQFFTRPEEGDLFYINFDVGQGPEFVGIDLVIRRGYDAHTLAGMYVIRQGEHFGHVIFYEAPTVGENKMIGPVTARSSFQAAATEELILIQNRDYGNTLLYPLAGSLYYVVPVYSTSGNYQDLRKLGLINAFDAQEVVWGSDAEEAYKLLNYTQQQTFEQGNVTLTYEIRDTPTLEGKIIDLNVLFEDDNLTAPQKHVVVNISLRTDIANITKFGQAVPTSNFTWGSGNVGMNFTVVDINLYPREGYSVGVHLMANISNVYSVTIEYKMILIVDGDIYEFPSDSWGKITIIV
ncbi:MAG: UPF0182 family protein [Promethearchaeota archaeon]